MIGLDGSGTQQLAHLLDHLSQLVLYMGQAGLLHGTFQRLQPIDSGFQPVHQHGVVRSIADPLQCGDHLVDLGNDLLVGDILGGGQVHAVEHILQLGERGVGGVQHLQQVV